MREKLIQGTKGYAEAVQKFIDATISIDFLELHKDFLDYFPKTNSRILDIGAGIGRDASVFSQMGHFVVAVEPTEAFRIAGKKLYESSNIEWIDDYLPDLNFLDNLTILFDFILVSGVWHHLNSEEQFDSMRRIARLLNPNGIIALTLRNGPSGVGTHVFPTNGKQLMKEAESCGLTPLLFLENQPSLQKNKQKVLWTKVILKKVI